jgi:predicted dinucleotide-binding enzyme
MKILILGGAGNIGVPIARREAGPLAMARWTEPLGMLLIKLGYVQGMGPMIGAPLLHYMGEKA